MEEKSLSSWTTCSFDQPGDVYAWDINKLNLTHDENIISAVEKVDKNLFCESGQKNKKEIHMFGDHDITSINYYEAKDLCKRLNGKMTMLPSDLAGNKHIVDILKDIGVKTNKTYVTAWVDGITMHGEKYAASHWVPETWQFEMYNPSTGEPLINDINRQFLDKEGHSYQKLVDLCFQSSFHPRQLSKFKYGLRYIWQKCNRNFIGKVLCEFQELPTIKIKGLCKNSPIDRDFQLISQKNGEGKAVMIPSVSNGFNKMFFIVRIHRPKKIFWSYRMDTGLPSA